MCSYIDVLVNPIKFNYLSLNADSIVLTINDQPIVRTHVAKYLGFYIDDKLAWKQHVEKNCHITINHAQKNWCI